MRLTAITQRLAGLGGDKWEVHLKARELAEAGADLVQMTIGEPDVATPQELVNTAISSMQAGRTGYSNGRGEPSLAAALAESYPSSCNRTFTSENVLCFPGTQTALYAVLQGVAETGTEVLVGDPMYSTYEGVICATGADMVPLPLPPEAGFRMQARDIAERITPRSRAILLTNPHNPTGSILTQEDLQAIGELAVEHDLWIISDEVYEHLVFEDATYTSILSYPAFADRVIAVSSISKSHAAPGFPGGWCIGPKAFCDALLPVSETLLFGNQPFIADMTEHAVREGSSVAPDIARRFSKCATILADRLHRETDHIVHRPEAGMFALVNVSATGMDGDGYAWDLLEHGVSVMPGSAFGNCLKDWVRLALTISDTEFSTALDRITAHANLKSRSVA